MTWRERVNGQRHRARGELVLLADALRAALADNGPGFISYRQLRDCYGGPPIASAARLASLVPALLARAIGDDALRVVHWRSYRERAAGVEVTRP